jgi:hypothetical protein
LLSYKTQKKWEKDIEKTEMKKEGISIIEILFDIVLKIINPSFGALTQNIVHDDVIHDKAYFTGSLIAWLREIFGLETNGKLKIIK